jgi:hypothetical protein
MPAPKSTTFDLLDADLTSEYARYASMSPADHNKFFRVDQLVISPHYWNKYGPEVERLTATAQWKEVLFKDLPQHISKQMKGDNSVGVYMFIARPIFTMYGLPGLVYYVGIAGEGDSHRPLKDRLKDYLNFENIKKRDRVHQALKLYYEVTYVRYACLMATGSELAALETALHGFFYPWASDRDFPAEVKAGRKAW